MNNQKVKLWRDKIPFLKELYNFYSKIEFEEVNLWPVMANDVYTYYKDQEQRGKINSILTILRCLFFQDKISFPKDATGKIFATYFMPRKDHQKFVHKALEKFSDKELFLFDGYEYKKKSKYSLSIPNLFLFFKILNKFRRSEIKKILGSKFFFFVARTYLRFKQINYFKKVVEGIKPRAYVAFCSTAFAEEAILTLLCKKSGIPTFALQHGFTIEYPDFSPISILNENIISDYNLIWGESTYNIQKKYIDGKRLIIAGNPKYSLKDAKKPKEEFNPKNGTVFLSVTGNEASNREISKIINEFAKKHPEIILNISAHPFDDINNYRQFISEKNINLLGKEVNIKDFLEKSDFIVIHNTSIAYEALLYGIPVFRFGDKALQDLWENKDKFANLKQLEEIFTKLKNKLFFKKQTEFYKKELNKNMYFDAKKEPIQVYYDKIIERLN